MYSLLAAVGRMAKCWKGNANRGLAACMMKENGRCGRLMQFEGKEGKQVPKCDRPLFLAQRNDAERVGV